METEPVAGPSGLNVNQYFNIVEYTDSDFSPSTDDTETSITNAEGKNAVDPVIYTMSGEIECDERPYLSVLVLGRKFTGLLDSGASITIVGSREQSRIRNLKLQEHPSSIVVATADGTKHSSTVYVNVPFEVTG